MEEFWKDIDGYEGYYQVSNLGKVKSLSRYVNMIGKKLPISGRVLKSALTRGGYNVVSLYKDGTKKQHKIHRLVAQAFIPNDKNLSCVLHRIESVPSIDIVDNLWWGSIQDNNIDKTKKGRQAKGDKMYLFGKKGENNPMFGKKGELHPSFGRTGELSECSKIVLDQKTGIFYSSAKEAAYAKNIPYGTLKCRLNGSMQNKTLLIYA